MQRIQDYKMGNKKIKIFQKHFANIDDRLLYEFHHKTGIINIISFIKKSVFLDFEIYLTSEKDLETLDKYLADNFYKDKSEWLREKMRLEIKKQR